MFGILFFASAMLLRLIPLGSSIYISISMGACGQAITKLTCRSDHENRIPNTISKRMANQVTTGVQVSQQVIPNSCFPPWRLRRALCLVISPVVRLRLRLTAQTEGSTKYWLYTTKTIYSLGKQWCSVVSSHQIRRWKRWRCTRCPQLGWGQTFVALQLCSSVLIWSKRRQHNHLHSHHLREAYEKFQVISALACWQCIMFSPIINREELSGLSPTFF